MRHWFLGLAVAVAAAGGAAAAPAAADRAEAVIKKAVEAHGGAEAIDKYKGGKCKMKGELSVLDMDLEFTGSLTYSLPDRYKVELDTEVMGQKMTIHQVVKGEKVKSTITFGGMELPADGDAEKDELKLAAAMQEAEQITPLLDKKKFSLKTADDEEVNGKKAAVVIVTPTAVKKDVKMYFDKSSGLLVKTSHKGIGPGEGGGQADVQEDSYFLDYKKVKGVQVPMKLEVKHDDKKFMTITMSDVELLDKVDDKEFTISDD